MKQQVCKNCKHLEPLPFSDTYICANGNGLYADCECDIENDTCDLFEDKGGTNGSLRS